MLYPRLTQRMVPLADLRRGLRDLRLSILMSVARGAARTKVHYHSPITHSAHSVGVVRPWQQASLWAAKHYPRGRSGQEKQA